MRISAPARVALAVLAIAGAAGVGAIAPATAALAAPSFEYAPSVQIGYTDSAKPGQAFEASTAASLPIGTTLDQGTAHTSRIYATFDVDAYIGTHFISATLRVHEASAADCTKRAIEVWSTRPVTATPTWRSAPIEQTKQDESLTPQFCPNAYFGFDVADAVSRAIGKGQSRVTFELRVPAALETDPSYARTFNAYSSVSLDLSFNHRPTVDNTTMRNAGFACGTKLRPTPAGGFANTLQIVAADADSNDLSALTVDFAVWPVTDASAVTHATGSEYYVGRYATATVADGTYVDGVTYAWRAQATDGLDTSPWSKLCYFTYDGARPSAPNLTSTNYPPSDSGQRAPIGVPGTFVLDGHGDTDIAGFEYTWQEFGVAGCEYRDYFELVCADPFTGPDTVKLKSPGGTATIKLNPPDGFYDTLSVRSIDRAGNRSATAATYTFFADNTAPTVTSTSGTPQWNQEVTLSFAPYPGVKDVTTYTYTVNGQEQSVDAAADGTASITFLASDPSGYAIPVRSISRNGFVSSAATFFTYFYPWPGVTSDVYPDDGYAHGGVGVAGTFTFTPPAGMYHVAEYRYLLPDGTDYLTVPAGPDGTASITWTPTTSGQANMDVLAVDSDGNVSDYSNPYSFYVN